MSAIIPKVYPTDQPLPRQSPGLSTVTLATLRPVQPVGECYSVASLTVYECLERIHRRTKLRNLSTVTPAKLHPHQPDGERKSSAR